MALPMSVAQSSSGTRAHAPSGSIERSPFLAAGSTPHDTEDGRALLQARVARFGRFGFLINFVFIFLTILLFVAIDIEGTGFTPKLLVRDMNKSLLIGTAVYGAVWTMTSRGRIGQFALYLIDVASIFIVSIGLCIGVWGLTEYARPELLMLLTLGGVLAIRAVMIPSSTLRSALVGAAAVAPCVVVTYYFYAARDIHYGNLTAPSFTLITLFLASPAVIVSTYISKTIYGLTEQVREATQLGQYSLDEKIGEGGMGVVYKARHSMLRRPTAVKLLPPERAGEHNLQRFEREVQLTSLLSHPNTIAIYDFGRTPDGVFYYAMEYLDGIDLEGLIEEDGPLDASRTIHILMQVTCALEEAHGVGLIHRDIKPANIILCERGPTPDVAKVLDFGLVKRIEGATDDSLKSAVNTITGTPLYLSPEAILAPDKVDGRSDLYALGCVGYWLLTGKHVFDAATIIEICGMHVHTAPTPPSVRVAQAVPPDLERIIMRCLAKSPADRPNASVLYDELSACTAASPWDVAVARQWWKDKGRRLKKSAAEASQPSGPALRKRTIAIDLRKRVSQG